MKRSIFNLGLVVMVLVASISASAQITILSETMTTGVAPSGWTVNNVTFSTGAGGYANFTGVTGELISPAVDLTPYSSVELTFSVAKFGTGTDGPITVEVSNDGGVTFTAQTFDSPTPTSSTYLTSGPTVITATGSNVVIRFTSANSPSGKRFRNVTLVGYDNSAVLGCTDTNACNYNALATVDDGSCDYSCLGCINTLACNYNASATIDDGSCLFSGDACDDGNPATINDTYDGSCNCSGILDIEDVIITEIHYNPNDGLGFTDAAYEFVELYNNDNVTIDLSGWSVGGVTLTFPGGTTIAPGEYIVCAIDAAFYSGNGYQVFDFGGGLTNGGETISLIDDGGNTIDSVPFDDANGWPIAAAGFGYSIELTNVALDNSLPTSWAASCALNGTPGAAPLFPCPVTGAETIATIQGSVDVNGGSVFAGDILSTTGVVTAVYGPSNLFTIQDGTGAYSGIWSQGSGVAVGDNVTVTGLILESFSLTLITSPTIVINSTGNVLPAAEVLTTAALNDEQWEGVLVSTTGDVVNGDLGNGEFSLSDGSGNILVDDLGLLATPLTAGDTYTVTGPLYFSFSAFKVEPRNAGDLQKWGCTDNAFPNYDPAAVIDDGSCGVVPGCTNPLADNYDPAATVDNGTCIISGCTDSLALNYDVNANTNDGSCYYTLPNLVINEIHYNPCTTQGNDDAYEFLEIYNAEATTVSLEGFTFSLGITFTFPAGASIAAGEYIIIAAPNNTTYAGNGYQVFIFTGALGNSGEPVELTDAFGNVIDSVTYGTAAPWPSVASCTSLELIDPSLDNSDVANWQASYNTNGTPGAENSAAPVPTSYLTSEIQSDVDANGGSNVNGSFVVTNGIVTAVYASNLFTIQDGSGPFSGIWVQGSGVALGDEVEVIATVTESFNLTLLTNTSISVLTSGNPLPAPAAVTTAGINDEQWEGVLLEVTGAVTFGDLGFGEWSLSDGSGDAVVDDLGIALTPVDVAVTYTVTGPVYYSFNAFKLEPRNLNDTQRWGCTDIGFPNYDPLAVIDDGSCADVPGCTDPSADNYDPTATVDNGSCVYSGCTDAGALNYNPLATIDNGTCYFTLPNIVINEIHYNPCTPQGDDFAWEFIELYNAGTTDAQVGGFTFTSPITFTFPAGSVIAAGEYVIVAVTASSYAGNGYQVFEITFGNLSNTSATITLQDGFGNTVDSVTYADTAPWPIDADGACTSLELIDATLDNADAANWQASYVLYGTPGAANSTNTPGCMVPVACNYNPNASFDDGSCEYTSCAGCTYPGATNYDVNATIDNGTCTFDLANPCPEDLNGDGIINAGDLLQFLGSFGSTCN